MSTLTREFSVAGMHCGGCVKSVTGAVSRVPGVKHVEVSLENNAAKVEFDGTLATPEADRRRDRRRGLRRSSPLKSTEALNTEM